ncbi:MAG: hypothetical protein LH647_09665 [Leptolyngbyaceae cyanobacterium CAN_BIN12]|nr:hypothetical protein [Leptolyngbyaceae cyanobacterium CAN_BIN12]
MFISRFFRKSALGHRSSHLVIVVFPDEGMVFQAYRLLHCHGISPENLAIVGQGYSSPDRVGLINPWQIVIRKAVMTAIAAAGVGVLIGLAIALFKGLHQDLPLILPAFGLLSGFCGGIIGAIFGIVGEGSTASVYRHHLRQGRYLLMMEGSEKIVRWGQEVLSYYSALSPH